jgi:hypothetical protein
MKKNIDKNKAIGYLLIIVFELFGFSLFSQNNYIKLSDMSGYNTDAYQTNLSSVADDLINSLPVDIKNKFKVYDFGFYIITENFEGGYRKELDKIINKITQQSPYYLIFGKETTREGLYKNMYVELNLPQEGSFSCLSDVNKKTYKTKISNIVKKSFKGYDTYHLAEIEGMKALKTIFNEIKQCCILGNTQCNTCNSEIIKDYLKENSFANTTITTGMVVNNTINTSNIKDYFNKKIVINGNTARISETLNSFVNQLNQHISFGLFVSSDNYFCSNTLESMEFNSKNNEFNCWIHILDNQANNPQTTIWIKSIWNSQKKQFANSANSADVINFIIEKFIYSQLNLEGNLILNDSELQEAIDKFFNEYKEPPAFRHSEHGGDRGDPKPIDISIFLWSGQKKIDMDLCPTPISTNTLGVARNGI